ncbi:hypothetical protein DCS_08217 [Drechmeria coniospora]|uniref:Uncharacterized protein n=1 Tax=Drechmeria coniospora TaxID=98403 RepID=A0A151GGL4_DRECN|nr:hypothetical protein DCS_08217 [Drechmeria coniospora]KYK56247.1 hypothetical protein DCS_08217 [Drechmeria coniospora]
MASRLLDPPEPRVQQFGERALRLLWLESPSLGSRGEREGFASVATSSSGASQVGGRASTAPSEPSQDAGEMNRAEGIFGSRRSAAHQRAGGTRRSGEADAGAAQPGTREILGGSGD